MTTGVSVAARTAARARRILARPVIGWKGRGAILLYHRVAEMGQDPWRLGVSPERFAEHMELLADSFRPMTLAELVARARRRSIPAGAVAVTFDDGYVDNLEEGAPALEGSGVPATVFIATGYVGRAAFWWDEIDALDRNDLQDSLRRSSPEDLEEVMVGLRDSAHAAPPAGCRPVSVDELLRLDASPAVDLGAHTRAHVSLAGLGREGSAREAEASRADLAEWLGSPPELFSYPFGDHGPSARRAARQAGFSAAVGTAPGAVTWPTDRFELPRLWVENEGADWLERRLRSVIA